MSAVERRPIPSEGAFQSSAASPISTPPWVTPGLIEQTIRVWQPYYPQPLTADDAIAMILNVGTLWRALSE
jgi:hypothetical protein